MIIVVLFPAETGTPMMVQIQRHPKPTLQFLTCDVIDSLAFEGGIRTECDLNVFGLRQCNCECLALGIAGRFDRQAWALAIRNMVGVMDRNATFSQLNVIISKLANMNCLAKICGICEANAKFYVHHLRQTRWSHFKNIERFS